MVQGWEYLPSNNATQFWIPDQHRKWVEFVVGSCSEDFFPGSPPSTETNTSKFPFVSESTLPQAPSFTLYMILITNEGLKEQRSEISLTPWNSELTLPFSMLKRRQIQGMAEEIKVHLTPFFFC